MDWADAVRTLGDILDPPRGELGLFVLPAWIIFATGWAGPALGLAFGDWEERAVGAAFVAQMTISYACGFSTFGTHLVLELELNAATLIMMVLVSLLSNKVWPLFNASLILLAVVTGAIQLWLRYPPWVYAMAQGTWEVLSNLVVLCAGVAATKRSWSRRRADAAGLPPAA